jgi:hypothetical protein
VSDPGFARHSEEEFVMSCRLAVFFVATLLTATSVQADPRAERLSAAIRNADRVVVAQVVAVDAAWKTNGFGDRLIVSRTWIKSEETLKGVEGRDEPVELEGGTVGGITLKVSDMPVLKSGDRAVFLLKRASGGELVPYQRGGGILRIDANEDIRALGMGLDEVRQLARQVR